MRGILKAKWFVIIAWIAVAVGLFIVAPNMADLVREKGQINVPDGYSSSLAAEILNNVQEDESKGSVAQTALVFHNENKLTETDFREAAKAISILEDKKGALGITSITTHFNDAELKDQLVSKDGKTILVALNVAFNGRETKEVTESLYSTLHTIEVDYYYTGSWMIDEDLVTNSQEGLKKTEGITVVFILIVLLLVFRSLIAPFVPLVTVGFTYLVSQSIVAILVDKLNFPLSTFTQIFLVAILFGIGTDYCILLLSRFKEEISNHESIIDAIVETYRAAGKTVFFSGLAVMIGFAAIGLSQFKLYQSAAAVAVGVAVLLIALITVVPVFMLVLGPKLFWPSKGNLEHRDSKLWDRIGRFSLARPILALTIVAAVTAPFLFTYDGDLSFNALEEIGGDVQSIKAFNIVSDSFGPGESMPTQIVIKNDEEMASADYIELAEKISQEVSRVDYVAKVRSVSRPTGEIINDMYVPSQAGELEKGLREGNNGIQQISDGLQEAKQKLSASEPQLYEATEGINSLISGTNELKAGMTELQSGLTEVENGLRQGSAGSAELLKGLHSMKANAEKLLAGSKELVNGYEQAGTGLSTLNNEYKKITIGLNGLTQSLAALNENFVSLEQSYEGLSSDSNYVTVKGTVAEVQNVISTTLSPGLQQLNLELSNVQQGVTVANGSFQTIIDGYDQLVNGMAEVIKGIEQQQAGIIALADGQSRIVAGVPEVTNGLGALNEGQMKLLDGFGDLNSQMGQLTDGLSRSVDGLNQVSDGLNHAQIYLSGLASKEKTTGFYIPDDVLKSEEFQQALDAYMSDDRKVMTFDVIFNVNPYSNTAIEQITEVQQAVVRVVKDTKLENAIVAIGGVTSTQNDLNMISKSDYSRTVVLMLAGIGIILFILLRSIIMPLYLIGSLILTYYTAMGISEMIFTNVLHYSGISWAVPFFAFVILVALGIDYSIFLMDRFNEYKDRPIEDAMMLSMRKMGTVIISAAIILGGTFAAMIPSGVLSLVEIATIVLTGLALYALIVLPLFVPVMVKTFGNANWWPLNNKENNIQRKDVV